MQGFNNSVIIPLRLNKPHIVFMQGYWRVSSLKIAENKCPVAWFGEAHLFVNKLNEPIAANRPWGYKNDATKRHS